MRMVCSIAILFVISLATAQQNSSPKSPNISEPKLPVIDYDACPGKTDPIPDVKLVNDSIIYSSPGGGKVVGRLSAGEKVTVLAGANVTRQPDTAVVKYVRPDDTSWPQLKIGDIVSGYGWHVDGNMVFWAKGVRFEEDIEGIAEKGECGFTSGFGPGGCTIDIVKDGVIEWWVQVKTGNGAIGWALAVSYNDDSRWYRWQGNFYDVLQDHCSLD
ncbi:MAG TPA: hypothetical protein VFA90_16110 [Terriglobales bacterium]|nr:hypothetical protein [Terriglobales bacterium]